MIKYEIGSEYNLDLTSLQYKENNIFNYIKEYNTLFVDSGRSGIRYLIKEILKLKKQDVVLIPQYICSSVIDCIKDIVNIKFYKINNDLNINNENLLKNINNKVKAILYVNYFGVIQNQKTIDMLKQLKLKNIQIIEDTTHSIFTNKCVIGDYCVCSLRKWFALPDGGVIYSQNILPNNIKEEFLRLKNIRLNAMDKKDKYLRGIINDKSKYLSLINEGEEILNNNKTIFKISNLSNYILSCYDIEELKRVRLDNVRYIHENLSNPNIKRIIKKINNNSIFLGYPIFVEDRDKLRKILIENNIFCAVHWPRPSEVECNEDKQWIANKEITIPIDQRYNIDEMKYILKIINEFK